MTLLAVTTVSLGACSGGGGGGGDSTPSSTASRAGSGGGSATTAITTVSDVAGGPLGTAVRQRTKKRVSAVVTGYLDGAFLGSFPRTDFGPAFAGFTPQAAKLAERQLDVLTNQAVSATITSATATRLRLRLSVFAPDGHARGVTVGFVLDDTTAGALKQDQRVRGQLYLTKAIGSSWQVFGFRVDQPVSR